MAEFNFNILEAGFKITLVDQTDTDCATIFNYRIFADDSDNITIDLSANAENASYTLNGVNTSFSSTVNLQFNSSLFLSFSVQNSGVPGTFNSVIIDLNNTTATKALESIATRNSDSPRCENLEYTFDGLTDTPETKIGEAGKFVRVNSDEDALEYVDIQGEVIFNSSLDPNLAMPEDVGGIKAGTTIQDLNDLEMNLTDFIELQNFETIPAYISQIAYTSISGQITSSAEVGTSTVQNFNITLNTGNINNGDNRSAGPVIGNISQARVIDPDGSTEFTSSNPPSNTVNAVLPAYIIDHGTNTWIVGIDNFNGTTIYTDNKGGAATVASIENAKSDTARDNVTFSRVGLYRRFHYIGTENGSPTTSAGVRGLTSAFLSVSNTDSFSVQVASGPGNAEFSFYIPQGKSFTVTDKGNLDLDITADFVTTNMQVNDANGTPVNYTKYTRFAGTLGYTNPTTFQITIS